MNRPELHSLAREIGLEDAAKRDLRLAFGVACVERVEHLLIDQAVIDALAIGKQFVAGKASSQALAAAAEAAARAAQSHAGTNSFDGSGSAAVSTSHAVAAALAGRAIDAADYAAYAGVYAYSSYAVTDPSAYASISEWQLTTLRSLYEG